MRGPKAVFAAVLFVSSAGLAADKNTVASLLSPVALQNLAVAAFLPPKIPFQANLMLTEWRQGDAHAEEVRLFFQPPESYRIEFLAFDGSVKKVVLTNEKSAYVSAPGAETAPLSSGPLQVSSLLTEQQIKDLLTKNYIPELKGAEVFIGRPVWVLQLTPRTPGKPVHELKIDKETLVVLEQRRYLSKQDAGSLTRFSVFQPNKAFASDVFPDSEENGFLKQASGPEVDSPTFSAVSPPPDSFQQLPAGFLLKGYQTFQVQGTTANYFTYTDGAMPLSVFKTHLPVHFPTGTSVTDKLAVLPENSGLASADQVFYGKRGEDYYTVIGEVSPDLLHTIADHFQ